MGLICRSLSASASEADPVERPSLLLGIHGANVTARTTAFSHSSARPCPMRSLSYRPLPERSAARYDSGSWCNRALLQLEAFYRRVDICERFPRPALRRGHGFCSPTPCIPDQQKSGHPVQPRLVRKFAPLECSEARRLALPDHLGGAIPRDFLCHHLQHSA